MSEGETTEQIGQWFSFDRKRFWVNSSYLQRTVLSSGPATQFIVKLVVLLSSSYLSIIYYRYFLRWVHRSLLCTILRVHVEINFVFFFCSIVVKEKNHFKVISHILRTRAILFFVRTCIRIHMVCVCVCTRGCCCNLFATSLKKKK